jgi:hypothetical protein
MILHYEVDAADGARVRRVELWGTRNNGRTWTKIATDPDLRSPMEAAFPAEGLWGIRLVVASEGGVDPTPRPGSAPNSYVEIDMVPPVVSAPIAKVDRDWIRLRWSAKDKNLVPDSAKVSYSTDPQGPWRLIASQLKATDAFTWKPRGEQFTQPLYFRVEVQDKAGNTAFATSKEPVSRESAEAEPRAMRQD